MKKALHTLNEKETLEFGFRVGANEVTVLHINISTKKFSTRGKLGSYRGQLLNQPGGQLLNFRLTDCKWLGHSVPPAA